MGPIDAARHILFDLNGTLLDPAAMAGPLGGSEADVELVHRALGGCVSAAMAETLSGGAAEFDFSDLLAASIGRELARDGRAGLSGAVVEAAARMQPFPEAAEAIGVLREAGYGVGVLTNSSAETARELLADSGLELDPILGTDTLGAFKPHPSVYAYGCEQLGLPPAQVTMVASHWWDLIGARRAGLRIGWVSRSERFWLEAEPGPGAQGADLLELAHALS